MATLTREPIKHTDVEMFDIGDQLLALRRKRGWTQTQLAKVLGIDTANISCMENGRKISRSLLQYYNKQNTEVFFEERNRMPTSTLEGKSQVYERRTTLDFNAIKVAGEYFSPENGGTYNIKKIVEDLALTPHEFADMIEMNGAGTYMRDAFQKPKSDLANKTLAELLNIVMISRAVFRNNEPERKTWLRLPNVEFSYLAPIMADRSKLISYLKNLV